MRKITIITVTYNAIDALSKTLNNLRHFRRKYYEYIIIDGGSTDGTLELIKNTPDLIDKWTSEKDNGIYDAMNKGWALADSDSHIIYLGAGDKLLSLPSIIDEDKYKVIYGDVVRGSAGIFKSNVSCRLILGNSIHHQALLVPKSINPKPPFDTKFKIYADFDFNQRLYKRNVIFKYCESLKGYASLGGVSEVLDIKEMTEVIFKNYGFFVMYFAYVFLHYQISKQNLKSILEKLVK